MDVKIMKKLMYENHFKMGYRQHFGNLTRYDPKRDILVLNIKKITFIVPKTLKKINM